MQAGLSQREFAERIGTTQSAVARMEKGEAEPKFCTLEKLAEALGRAPAMPHPAARRPLLIRPGRPATAPGNGHGPVHDTGPTPWPVGPAAADDEPA